MIPPLPYSSHQSDFTELGKEVETVIGSLIPFPEAGAFPLHPSVQHPEVQLAATLGKIDRMSRTHNDPHVRAKLAETITRAEHTLASVGGVESSGTGRKPPLSVRVIRSLTKLKKDLPFVYRLLLISLVALLAPIILGALPVLPLLGM